MAQKAGHGVVVQLKLGYGVADQKQALGVCLPLAQGPLALLYRRGLQPSHLFLANSSRLGQLHHAVAPLHPQSTPGRRHTGPCQSASHALFQALGHLGHHTGHLGNVFNLAVHHGPFGVGLLLHRQNMDTPLLHTAQHPDHASGAYVQGVNQILLLKRTLLQVLGLRHMVRFLSAC